MRRALPRISASVFPALFALGPASAAGRTWASDTSFDGPFGLAEKLGTTCAWFTGLRPFLRIIRGAAGAFDDGGSPETVGYATVEEGEFLSGVNGVATTVTAEALTSDWTDLPSQCIDPTNRLGHYLVRRQQVPSLSPPGPGLGAAALVAAGCWVLARRSQARPASSQRGSAPDRTSSAGPAATCAAGYSRRRHDDPRGAPHIVPVRC